MERQLTVTGMNCGGCESTVEDALSALEGVEDVSADNEADTVTVEGDADEGDLVATIEDAGFEVSA